MHGRNKMAQDVLQDNQLLFDVIKKVLWDTGSPSADEAVFQEMKTQAIALLAGPVLMDLGLSEELFQAWEKNNIMALARYQKCIRAQAALPITVPYVILKGTSAAQYYPYPEYRMLGDIDVMASHENYRKVCEMLLLHGYEEHTNAVDQYLDRHRGFTKNGILIEVHSFYGLRDDKEEVKALDDFIIDNISESHVLPDLINGLTLIEHINHHMESGLGLRQVIDWMMFVHQCLPDNQWPEFEKMAEKTGHVRLAKTVTRMCEIYLGLPEHQWCAQIDDSLCADFMDYLLSCGNFGRKKERDSQTSEFLLSTPSLKAKIITLKQRGVMTWKLAQKYPALRSVAWLYQAGRYLIKGLFRRNPIKKIKAEFQSSRKSNELFDAIGVSREKKGRVTYQNGQYLTNKH